jgi:hypothetical protein
VKNVCSRISQCGHSTQTLRHDALSRARTTVMLEYTRRYSRKAAQQL